jgi:energy-coupling factor transporter ATP-binding protein EcfA2
VKATALARRREDDDEMIVDHTLGPGEPDADWLAHVDGNITTAGELRPIEPPTFEDPFRNLPFFNANALWSRQTIEAEADKPIEYFWHLIASAGQIVMIAGPSGGGKTTLVSILIVALANTGEPIEVLGYRVTPAAARRFIVFVEAEHGKPSAARKLVKACRIAGIDPSALDRIIVLARSALQMGTDAWRELGRLVEAGLAAHLILDTLPQVAPGDANDEKMQAEIMRSMTALIELAPADGRPVIWPVVHTRKSGADALEDVSGSVQRIGGADTVLIVNPERVDGRVVASKVTFAKLREDPDPEPWPMPVTFTIEGGRITINGAQKRDERPLEERVLSLLEIGGKTKSEMKDALHVSGVTLETAITSLFGARRITTGPMKKVRGREFQTFVIRGAE